jgi:hypothetical protein
MLMEASGVKFVQAVKVDARVTREELVIRFRARSDAARDAPPPSFAPSEQGHPAPVARSCATCGETGCFRHEHRGERSGGNEVDIGRCAFLVDENWPEFQEYVDRAHRPNDVFGLPLDGATWRLARYRWGREGFAQIDSAPLQALRRAMAVRGAPAQGAARRGVTPSRSERRGSPADSPGYSPRMSQKSSSPNRCCRSCGTRVIWAGVRSTC